MLQQYMKSPKAEGEPCATPTRDFAGGAHGVAGLPALDLHQRLAAGQQSQCPVAGVVQYAFELGIGGVAAREPDDLWRGSHLLGR